MEKINPPQAYYIKLGRKGKLDLFSPINRESYSVQVKSSAGHKEFEQFQEKTSEMDEFNRHYFVVHTPANNLTEELETETHKLWLPDDIADLIIRYGLTDWVIEKAF